MATVIRSIGISGIEGYPVEVQVKVMSGLTMMSIVGLGDQAVKEAKERVEAAFDQVDLEFPKKKIIVNLSPSDIKKSGTYYELPMTIALIIESDQLAPRDLDLDEIIFLGGVGLTGELVHFNGVLPMVLEARKQGFEKVVVPYGSLMEASKVEGIEIFGFKTLGEVIRWMEKRLIYTPPVLEDLDDFDYDEDLDFYDVDSHDHLMKYVIAAAAGAHNMLMVGPAGCGKSMVAKRIPGILPDLTEDEAIEVMTIRSVSGERISRSNTRIRPFMAPHANVSMNALVGGGTHATPGIISLAHNGVLFLDELPEFSPQAIESLRQPMEDHVVSVARVRQTNTFPANFMLVAAMNPCKCGNYGDISCKCTPSSVAKYRQRVSGPIYDRIDIQKYMEKVDLLHAEKHPDRLRSSEIKELVTKARLIQEKRFSGLEKVRTNAQMGPRQIKEFCTLDSECREFMEETYRVYPFSARSYNKFLALARTFADLDGAPDIRKSDLLSALMARDLDREDNQKKGRG